MPDSQLRKRRAEVVPEHMGGESRLDFDSVFATFSHLRHERIAADRVFDRVTILGPIHRYLLAHELSHSCC